MVSQSFTYAPANLKLLSEQIHFIPHFPQVLCLPCGFCSTACKPDPGKQMLYDNLIIAGIRVTDWDKNFGRLGARMIQPRKVLKSASYAQFALQRESERRSFAVKRAVSLLDLSQGNDLVQHGHPFMFLQSLICTLTHYFVIPLCVMNSRQI